MAILIVDKDIENQLDTQTGQSLIKTSKGPLAKAILRTVLTSADAQNINVFELLQNLPTTTKRKRGSKAG